MSFDKNNIEQLENKEEVSKKEIKSEKKVMFEQPLGKTLMAIGAFYGLIVAVIAFTYDKNLYFFLENSMIVIIVDCFLLLFLLIIGNMKYLDEEQPSFFVSFFERSSLSIFAIIVSFLFMSFMNKSLLSNEITNKTFAIVSFTLIQFIFGNIIIISNLTLWLNVHSINFYRRKEHIIFIARIREWFTKNNKYLVTGISLVHTITVVILYGIFVSTETIKIAVDWVFFIEMIIQILTLSWVFAMLNFRFENKLKKSQKNEESAN